MSNNNHTPIWLIITLIAIAVVGVTMHQVIYTDSQTDLVLHETRVPR